MKGGIGGEDEPNLVNIDNNWDKVEQEDKKEPIDLDKPIGKFDKDLSTLYFD